VRRGNWLVLVTIALFLALGVALSNKHVLGARVTVSWSYDYTSQPACDGKNIAICIDHFEIIDYTNAERPRLLRMVANPEHAVGAVDNISETFIYGPPFGLRTIVVVAVGRDKRGSRVSSNPYAARKELDIRPRILAR